MGPTTKLAATVAAASALVSLLVVGVPAPTESAYAEPARPLTAVVVDAANDRVVPVRLDTGAQLAAIPAGNNPEAIAIDPSGTRAWVTNPSDDTVTPIDLTNGTQRKPIVVEDRPSAIAVSPDGSTVWVANRGGGTVTPINAGTGSRGSAIVAGPGPEGIAVAPNGATVYVTASGANSVVPIDVHTRLPELPIPVGNAPKGIATTPDGSRLIVATAEGVRTVNADTHQPIALIPLPEPGEDIAVSPDGLRAYVTHPGGSISVVDLSISSVVRSGVQLRAPAVAVTVSPSGSEIHLVHDDDTISVIDPDANPLLTRTLTGTATPRLAGLAMSPDQAAKAQVTVSSTTTVTCQSTPPSGVSSVCVDPGATVSFDASGSVSETSPIATYTWNFDDGTPFVTTTSPTVSHVYAEPGSYNPGVLVTTAAGTSYFPVFTGQTMTRNGNHGAIAYAAVLVSGAAIGINDPVLYVANFRTSPGVITPVGVRSGEQRVIGERFAAGANPAYLAMDPTGRAIVSADFGAGTVSVATACPSGTSIDFSHRGSVKVGGAPASVAVTPMPLTTTGDRSVYVVFVTLSGSSEVRRLLLDVEHGSTLETCSAALRDDTGALASLIPLAASPYGIALTPDAQTAYVTNPAHNTVTPIDLRNNQPGVPIPVGSAPHRIAITPDGQRAYVANSGSGTVTPITLATREVGEAIAVGSTPEDVAISPDGRLALVTASGSSQVTAIDVTTNTVIKRVPLIARPTGVFFAPAQDFAYVTSYESNVVIPLDVAKLETGNPISGFDGPVGAVVSADQPGTASLTLASATPAPCPPGASSTICVPVGAAVTFDASASTGGTLPIATYTWNFGDGTPLLTTTASSVSHTYEVPGTFEVGVFVTTEGGTSYHRIYTGQTVSRNGSWKAVAVASLTVTRDILAGSPLLYVADGRGNHVVPVDISVPGEPRSGTGFPVGQFPTYAATDPLGRAIVTANYSGGSVSVTSVCSDGSVLSFKPSGTQVGLLAPVSVAINPKSGSTNEYDVYVTESGASQVRRYLLTIASDRCDAQLEPASPLSASIIPVGASPYGIAFVDRADGRYAYVSNSGHNTVTPIRLSDQQVGLPIPVGVEPRRLAASGSTVYVVNRGSGTVTPIDTATNQPGAAIPVGSQPEDITVTNDGSTAYVTATASDRLVEITLETRGVVSIPTSGPIGVALSADETIVYVSNFSSGTITSVTRSSRVVGRSVSGFYGPVGLLQAPSPTGVRL